MPTINPLPIDRFLSAIAKKQPVLSLLGLSPTDFTLDSFEQLLENAHDVGQGVTSVSRKVDTLFFGLFTQLEVKEHGDGSTRYNFTGLVQNAAAISNLAAMLHRIFGQGIHSPEHLHQPFTRTDTLAVLIGNTWPPMTTMLFETWVSENRGPTLSLRYGAVPRHELLLAVKQRPNLLLDTTVRSRGTVADLLHLRLADLLQQSELRKEVNLKDGQFHSVLYEFALAEPELGIFDRVEVRLFEPERVFTHDTEVNLTLATSRPVPGDKLVRMVEQLIRLYGAEGSGANELAPYEVEDLHGKWWTGRMWQFTEQHTIWQLESSERMAYGVNLSMYKPGQPELTIHGYNSLLALFTTH
jgi:hypothetical protein